MEYNQSLLRLMKQSSKIINTKIEILNMSDVVVGNIEGLCTEVSVSIDNSDLIRRTLDITFIAHKSLEINNASLLWINKRIRLYIGIEKYSGETQWFNMGIYVISNPETSYGSDGRTISIKGYDKMKLFDKPFMSNTEISSGTPIHTAVKGLAALIGETKLLVEDSDYTIPETVQTSPSDDIQDTLKDIVNLYMNYDVYYNLDGYLVFEKMKNKKTDAVIWEFSDDTMTISREIECDYDSVKNHIKVFGYLNEDTAVQPLYELSITDNTNDFSISNIGDRSYCIEEDSYTTEEQCRLRCEYELEQVKNLAKVFSIDCVPILLLNDVNKVINVVDNRITYTCLVDKIDVGLDSMSIQCHEIFS